MPRRMHLALFLGRVGAGGAWRLPDAPTDDLWSLEMHARCARLAEAARFDAVFRADNPWLDHDRLAHSPVGTLDPLVLLGALSTQTQHVGLVATSSTAFSDPFTVARQFASLDHLSGGRAGWNFVASERGETNFGGAAPAARETKHERSAELVEVVRALWDSWDEDALLLDREAGRFADPSRVHRVGHVGTHFRVEGPLDVPRPPQGRPALVTTATSPQGTAVAARHADAIYSTAADLDGARAAYARIKAAVADAGRDPDEVKVLLAVSPVVGETDADARRLADRLDELTDVSAALPGVATTTGLPLDRLPLDEPIAPEALREAAADPGASATARRLLQLALDERHTPRRLVLAAVGAPMAIWEPVGGVERLADEMATWFEAGACDGFNINPSSTYAGVELVTEGVVPLLQARGLFRRDYEADTLRGHLAS